MTVVIADDEGLSRYSLKSMLLEAPLPLTVVGEAKNGEELVSIVRRLTPDLAFVDIRMPALDGLAAIAKARELSPDTHWVILTSYPEFDYAKQALRLGVSDYLLKPVAPAELKAALERRVKSLEAERASRAQGFEAAMSALLNRTAAGGPAGLWEHIEELRCAAIIVHVDGRGGANGGPPAPPGMAARLREAASGAATAHCSIAIVTLSGGTLCVIVAWSGREQGEGSAAFRRLLNRSRGILSGDQARHATILASEELRSFPDLAQEVWHLHSIKGVRALVGPKGVTNARELIAVARDPQAKKLAALVDDLLDAARSAMALSFIAALDEIDRILSKGSSEELRGYRTSMVRFFSRALPWELPAVSPEAAARSVEASAFHAYLEGLRAASLRAMRDGHEGEAPEGLVEQVRSYVDRRYAEDLTIAEVARLLGITPNYLSNLFHKKTGTRFIRYLTERRIERAKELLAGGHSQVQTVAASVGFRSTRHFARVFKALCGVYPSEYRSSGSAGSSP